MYIFFLWSLPKILEGNSNVGEDFVLWVSVGEKLAPQFWHCPVLSKLAFQPR